jgi:nucleoside-diphosphate-sugar epimerase
MLAAVTGGNGFIGTNLCGALVDLGFDVLVIDPAPKRLRAEGVRHIPTRVQDIAPERLQGLLSKARFVFHLAASAQDRSPLDISSLRGTVEDDLLSLVHVLEACAGVEDLQKIVVTGMKVGWGSTEGLDAEAVETVLRTPSGIVGFAAEQLCLRFGARVPVGVARFGGVYGPYEPFSKEAPDASAAVAALANAKLDGEKADLLDWARRAGFFAARRVRREGRGMVTAEIGFQKLDLAYVSDIVEGLIKLARLEQPRSFSPVFNLGSGRLVSIHELFDLMKVSPQEGSPPAPESSPGRPPDLSKAEMLLEWRPAVALEDGLETTVEWWRKERELD